MIRRHRDRATGDAATRRRGDILRVCESPRRPVTASPSLRVSVLARLRLSMFLQIPVYG